MCRYRFFGAYCLTPQIKARKYLFLPSIVFWKDCMCAYCLRKRWYLEAGICRMKQNCQHSKYLNYSKTFAASGGNFPGFLLYEDFIFWGMTLFLSLLLLPPASATLAKPPQLLPTSFLHFNHLISISSTSSTFDVRLAFIEPHAMSSSWATSANSVSQPHRLVKILCSRACLLPCSNKS